MNCKIKKKKTAVTVGQNRLVGNRDRMDATSLEHEESVKLMHL